MNTTRLTGLWALAAMLQAACADDVAPALTPVEDWTAAPEYEIASETQDDVLFGPHLDVRATADGSRVYALDLQASEVTVWTPGGALVNRVGRSGGGPGEFQGAGRIGLSAKGFHVRDFRGVTTFAPDGEFAATRPFPLDVSWRDMPVQLGGHFADGSFVALPSPAVLDGRLNTGPAEGLPVLRIVEEDGAWRTEELAQLDFRNWQTSVVVESGADPVPFAQAWVIPDAFAVDHRNGSVVIQHAPTASPGSLELTEISAAGDTLWTRTIQLPPMPLTEAQIDAEVDEWAAMIAASMGNANASPMLKNRLRAAWFIPEYWPAVRAIRLMSNGEVWFEPLGVDAAGIWYAVRKGSGNGPIRRIAVPHSFQPLDANATHAWGVRRDELDVGYVTGLRLRPGQQQERQ